MKILKVALLLGILALLAEAMSAGEKSAMGIQPVYLVRVTGDTIWFCGRTFRQPLLFSQFKPGDSTNGLTFEGDFDTLWVSGSPDSTVVLPTTEPIRFWFCSDRDSVLQTWSCAILKPDTAKLGLLRTYSKFGRTLPTEFPKFTYAVPSDSNLTRLRLAFHLDSIAGTGDEFSRQRNLLRWVHKRIRHDGNSSNPSPANAEHIISICDSLKRGVNCRMLATTLNEMYLAMGFKSRHLTCLPFDTLDTDCHVINMVWSTQFNKWLYMDPTYDAYWMNVQKVPLSPWEVRRSIEVGDSLVVSDSINWNGQPKTRLEYYNYMAKNLFRFMAPRVSSFGYESTTSVKELCLNPSAYQSSLLGKSDSTKYKGLTYYYTDNADWFFAPPQ